MVSQDILIIGVVLIVIFISMTLHEVMHGLVAYLLGDDTAKLQGRLTLNPLPHVDPFMTVLLPVLLAIFHMPIFGGAKPVPFNPNNVRYGEWGVALVALAGPLTNFILAFIFFGVGVVLGFNPMYAAGSISIWELFIYYGVMVNLGFFVFNLLPIPPLDGSRILYALAPDFVRRGMEYLEQYGLIVIFALVMLTYSWLGMFLQTIIFSILNVFSKIFIT